MGDPQLGPDIRGRTRGRRRSAASCGSCPGSRRRTPGTGSSRPARRAARRPSGSGGSGSNRSRASRSTVGLGTLDGVTTRIVGRRRRTPARRTRPGLASAHMEDIATAAVEAALAAGASYADARVMEMRSETMTARNGAVEGLDLTERAGVGVRALIGSSWGFFAVPDVGTAAARRAGERAAAVARASTRVPGKALGLAAGTRRRAAGKRVPRGPVVGDPGREGRPARRGDPDDARRRRGPSPRPATRSGTPRSGSSRSEGTPGRPAHRRVRRGDERHRRRRERDPAPVVPGHPRPVRDARLGAHPRARPPGQRGPDRRGGAGAPDAPMPARRSTPPTSSSAASRWRSRSTSRSATPIELDRILGWEAAFAGTSWLDLAQLGSLRFGSELMNITADATLPGRARQLRLRRRGHAGPAGRHRPGRHLGRRAVRAATRRPLAGITVRRRGPGRRLRPDADGPDDERGPAARRQHSMDR